MMDPSPRLNIGRARVLCRCNQWFGPITTEITQNVSKAMLPAQNDFVLYITRKSRFFDQPTAKSVYASTIYRRYVHILRVSRHTHK